MDKLLIGLLLIPSWVLAGSNAFIEQDLGKIKQQNQQIQQRLTESSQSAAEKTRTRYQSFNNQAMQRILYAKPAMLSNGVAPARSPVSSVHQSANKPQSEQFTTPASQAASPITDNVTGLQPNSNQQETNQSTNWNYGF